MLTINNIHSQQNLNNRKEKLRDAQPTVLEFSFGVWLGAKLSTIYCSVKICVK